MVTRPMRSRSRTPAPSNDHVFVPHGTYVFNSQVNVDRSNITITGENHGSGAVSIRLARAAGPGCGGVPLEFLGGERAGIEPGDPAEKRRRGAGRAEICGGARSRITNCYIEGLADKGNDTTAIQFDGSGTYSGDVDVENCYLTAHRIAVDLQRVCTTVRILNCEIYGTQRIPGTIGVRVSALCAGVLISGNSVRRLGRRSLH